MKLHSSVITEALKWGVPLRRDEQGYYHIVNPSTGKSIVTSMTPTAAGGLALIRKWRRKGTRKNPTSAARRDDAVANFKQFHDVEPEQIVEITIDKLPAAVWTLGELVELTYYAPNFEGAEALFRHKFSAKARPLLTVTPEQKLFIAGGRYRVDDQRGIMDQR